MDSEPLDVKPANTGALHIHERGAWDCRLKIPRADLLAIARISVCVIQWLALALLRYQLGYQSAENKETGSVEAHQARFPMFAPVVGSCCWSLPATLQHLAVVSSGP